MSPAKRTRRQTAGIETPTLENGSAVKRQKSEGKESATPKENGNTVKENGNTLKENGNIVKENGGTVKETGGTVKENGNTVKENGGIVKENGPSSAPKAKVGAARLAGGDRPSGGPAAKTKLPGEDRLLGAPMPKAEAQRRWPLRYEKKKNAQNKSNGSAGDDEEQVVLNVKAHYLRAQVDGELYNLGDCASVKGEDGKADYIGSILEFFETTDGKQYFTTQWFYRAEDTAIKTEASFHDKKRVFYSEIKDDNLLECITSKVYIVQVPPMLKSERKESSIPPCDYYYDMGYNLAYTTFYTLPAENVAASSDSTSTVCDESENKADNDTWSGKNNGSKSELTLLDLYSGCGGMSTGLCFGANLSGVNLVTKWAVDLNEFACKSLKHNHPETEVRNELADDFLELLKHWKNLYQKYCGSDGTKGNTKAAETKNQKEEDDDSEISEEEFEVESLIGIRYKQATKSDESGLQFKVHWKGYDESEDSWEPVEGLGDCEESMKEFVMKGAKAKLLPLPGDVDVICGGPPCQGASGFNRFRNTEAPLEDSKNQQIIVYMDIVDFLKPRYVLMENVVDILKFAGGVLGRYALSRLVHMSYQAKLGMMVAGCYGLPQFRMRVFLWGALPTEKLPQYPLPTHDVVQRGGVPNEWERNMVAYDENHTVKLEKALILGDAISDLPEIANSEQRDEMQYGKAPRTEFQQYIRMPKEVMNGRMLPSGSASKRASQKAILYDHRPLQLNEDDYQRVCRIPKNKGANFRDLPGVIIREDNVVELDTSMERILLPSGKPLIPDYAISFVKGRSLKPFGRLWWDETVPTVVTRAEPHNQAVLHPEQDRVLSIRENARLQGFPDYYKLHGTVKERYIQVGNAVAVPVARALGFALGMAIQKLCTDEPVVKLPEKFPLCFDNQQNEDGAMDVGEQT